MNLPKIPKLGGVYALIFAILILYLQAEILGQPRAASNLFLLALLVVLLVIIIRKLRI